jgi:hypothetical protein
MLLRYGDIPAELSVFTQHIKVHFCGQFFFNSDTGR